MNVNKNRVLDAASVLRTSQRVLRVQVPDGKGGTRTEERIERRPGQRHERMLNPAGSVVAVVLGNANIVAEEFATAYAGQIKARKLALGFLPWGRCPVAMVGAQILQARHIKSEEVRNSAPCTSGDFGPDNPCPHALAEQKFRRDAHEAKERDKAEAYKAEAERDREQREQHHADLMKGQQDQARTIQTALEALVSRATADDGGGKKGGNGR